MGIDADIDEAARSKVDERLKDSIFCPVCKLILEDPVNLNCCGGHLCSKCRDGVLRTGYSNCPFCRKPNFTATKGRLMVDVLSTLQLICPNTDCRSSIPYEKYEEHKKNCLALHEKKCPECEQTTSLSKFHEHFKCFEKMAAKNAATKEENASLKTRLTEAEERLAGMTGELGEMKKEQPPSAGTRSKKRKRNEAASNEIQHQKKRAQKRNELERMEREIGAIGGAGHFFENDIEPLLRHVFNGNGVVRHVMAEKEIRNILKMLALGVTQINLKFGVRQALEVEENGWKIKFIGAHYTWTRPKDTHLWHLLWISNKDGGVPFKAVVDEMNWDGDVETTRDGTSEPEGQKQLMKHKWIGGKNVRYNVTLL